MLSSFADKTYRVFLFICSFSHRINTSEFKLVDYLSEKFVVQVACGQQHTVCRVVDRENSFREEPTVGTEEGADVYIWGNGTLGQLGLGRPPLCYSL